MRYLLADILCFVAGHRWLPHWSPGLTWRGRKCSRCKRTEKGFLLMCDAYDALPREHPLRVHMDEMR